MAVSLLSNLWHRLTDWFVETVPPAEPEPVGPASAQDAEADEARRTSIHDVTHEQLGLAHWTCHALF